MKYILADALIRNLIGKSFFATNDVDWDAKTNQQKYENHFI